MKSFILKSTLSFLFIFCFSFFFINISVLAQSQPSSSQRWVCLNTDWCLDQDAFAQGKIVINPLCAPQLDASGKPIPNGHRVRLTAKSDAKPLPNKDTYIVECLSTTNGEICTTGNTTTDTLIYGKDNAAVLNASDEYQFQGIFLQDGITASTNPVTSLGNGDINPVEWQSYSKGNSRKFLALNYIDSTDNGNWLGQGGEQQGTFSFETQSNLQNCVSIMWDPYGRVFDSKTLEPIPGASVTLLKKRDGNTFTQLQSDEVMGGAINNPYLTEQDGAFSFVVPDSTYKLSVIQQNYSFPATNSVNPNYTQAYSDIYPDQTGVEIIQQGQVQHRDIPLDPKGQGITYPVKLMQYFYNLDKATNTILIDGLVSHPLTKIKLYSLQALDNNQPQTRGRLLKTLQADKFGKFTVDIDQTQLGPTEVFGDIELEKIDLTASVQTKKNLIDNLLSLILGKAFKVEAAQPVTTTIRLNPILNKLQGYAYNSNKQIMPNATVGVYLAYANKPYAETKTDQQGFYTFDSNMLPDSPYTIKYILPQGGTTSVSTTRFIAQNSAYLSQNKINLNANLIKPTPISNKQKPSQLTPAKNNTFSPSQLSLAQQTGVVQKTPTINSSMILIVIILLVLFGGVAVLLGMYILRKNQSQSQY